MRTHWLIPLFCASVVYLTFFYKLGNLAFIGADEPRYARISEEMNLRQSYITPTLNFRPWLEKPPLLFWIEALSFKIFGVSESSARLPVTLLALFAVFMMASLASDFGGGRTAVLTILVLSTSGLFFVFARAASTDMPLVALLTTAIVTAFKATRTERLGWPAAAGLALGLAVLAKGPVALVLFAGVFMLYFLLTEELAWNWGQVAAMTGLLLVTALPWFWKVWLENGYSFIATFWINHHLARFLTSLHHHTQPFWFYFAVLAVGFFPWISFLGSSVRRCWHVAGQLTERPHRPELFLWLWALVPVVFFSLSESKLAGYILPSVPPLAAIVALEWHRYLGGEIVSRRLMQIQLILSGVVTVAVSGALLWLFSETYNDPETGILLAVPILAGMGSAIVEYRGRRLVGVFLSLVAGMTLFAGVAYWKAAPVVDDFHSARDISFVVSPLISSQEPAVLYRYFHHSAAYYTNYRTIRESIPDIEALRRYFDENPQDQYYILTQKRGWRDLESIGARLLHHQGNLYLVEVRPKGAGAKPGKTGENANMTIHNRYGSETVQYLDT